jgi:DNA-binding CsgD family transcriptional regulator
VNEPVHIVAARLLATTSVDELDAAVGEALSPLGMTAWASGMVSGARALGPSPFHFVHWPADWLKLYQAEGFVKIDPLPRWAIVSGEALSWTEIVARLPSNDPGHRVVNIARGIGFAEGFVTPVRTARGDLGLVSVGGGPRSAFTLAERLMMQAISSTALRHAESLIGSAVSPVSILTIREAECVGLLRQGFTDPEIGRALTIAPDTARFHLENARHKLGARNRVDLAVRAGAGMAG